MLTLTNSHNAYSPSTPPPPFPPPLAGVERAWPQHFAQKNVLRIPTRERARERVCAMERARARERGGGGWGGWGGEERERESIRNNIPTTGGVPGRLPRAETNESIRMCSLPNVSSRMFTLQNVFSRERVLYWQQPTRACFRSFRLQARGSAW